MAGMPAARTFHIGHALIAFLIAVAAHAVVAGAAVLAGRLTGSGMEGLGAIADTLLLGEVVVLLASLAVGLTYAGKRRADRASGVLGGGLLPAVVVLVMLFAS